MGNSELQSYHHSAKSILISHPMFEHAKIIKNSQAKQTIQIRISIKSEKDFLLWEKNFKRIPKIPTLFYPENATFQNNACCGSTGFALVIFFLSKVQYPRFPYVLSQEIEFRNNNNMRHFDESQLWLLLYGLLSCAEIFHIRKFKIGDIRPINIFMNQEGMVKVASQFSFPYESVNYQKTLMDREVVTYLAPEQVRNLQLGKMKDSSQPQVAEPFSIGLTLLDAALLSSSENFYMPNGTFSLDRLNDSLVALCSMNYSEQLIDIIHKLCEPNVQKRVKLMDIFEKLKPHENQILLKKPFDLGFIEIGLKRKQNPNPESNEISRISTRKETPNPKSNNGYKYVNGVVFDHFENSIDFSSLNQSKELLLKLSKQMNSYSVKENRKLPQLQCPVQTTIYRPPTVVSLPPPVQHGLNPQDPNQNS